MDYYPRDTHIYIIRGNTSSNFPSRGSTNYTYIYSIYYTKTIFNTVVKQAIIIQSKQYIIVFCEVFLLEKSLVMYQDPYYQGIYSQYVKVIYYIK